MTDFTPLLQPDRGGPAHAVHLVDKIGFEAWLKRQPAPRRALLAAHRLDGKTAYQFAILPDDGADGFEVVATVANAAELSPWCLAKLGESLPEGTYRLVQGDPGIAAFGWLVGQHRFTRYRKPKDERGPRVLLTKDPAVIADLRKARFLIVHSWDANHPLNAVADVLLPATIHVEKEGTYTNLQGRVQEIHAAYPPKGQAVPDVEIFHRIAARLVAEEVMTAQV